MDTPTTTTSSSPAKRPNETQDESICSGSFLTFGSSSSDEDPTHTPNPLKKVSNWLDSLPTSLSDTECGDNEGGSNDLFEQSTFKQNHSLSPVKKKQRLSVEKNDAASPESEKKKKELCSYLQLMKPTDKTTIMTLQNRRSTRVKNLSIMHERKQLEHKLRLGQQELHFPAASEVIVKQSFSDFEKVMRESILETASSSRNECVNGRVSARLATKVNGFSFPKPPPCLTKKISDFDKSINKLIDICSVQKTTKKQLSNKNADNLVNEDIVKQQNCSATKNSLSRSKCNSLQPDNDRCSVILAAIYDDSKSPPENQQASASDNNQYVFRVLNIQKPKTNGECIAMSPPSASPSRISHSSSIKKETPSTKPFYNCLNITSPRSDFPSFSDCSSAFRKPKSEHCVNISKKDGAIVKVCYQHYNLVICQESFVSFWTQSALGNVLGAQNMWMEKGKAQRLKMDKNCILKEACDVVVSTDSSFAFVELWTKEHASKVRVGPVADVFIAVYFWRKGHSNLEKKVLQLENINGFADDVQYSVLKSLRRIVISWHLSDSPLETKVTYVQCYEFANDFQTCSQIIKFQPIEHYVSSLHSIEDCGALIMGCGENKITLWNVENGRRAVTIELSELKLALNTLWVKCDRGFLFVLQQCVDNELRLIAIHGMNHSWKKLGSYVPPSNYSRLKGVFVDNGVTLACYEQGVICWNAYSGKVVVQSSSQGEEYHMPGKYILTVSEEEVNLQHATTYLLLMEGS